jgi:DNA topoisomerase IB
MPPLSQQTKDLRILQAMEATRLMTMDVKKSNACEQAGISIRQYDYWLAKDNGAIQELQQVIIESERVRLADITNAYAIILRNMLSIMLQPGVDPLTSLMVLKFLDKLKADLEKKHGVNSETDAAETYLLKGPTLRIEESKMVSIKVTANPDSSALVQLPFSR